MAEPPRHRADERNSPVTVLAVLITVVGVLAVFGLMLRGPSHMVLSGQAIGVPAKTENHANGKSKSGKTSSPRPQRSTELAGNPLLDASVTLPKVRCELPRLGRTDAKLIAYYQAVITCLNHAWQPVLADVGEPFEAPKLNTKPGAGSACGPAPAESEATAFYCSRDETIYMPKDRLLSEAGVQQAPHLDVLSHEYGHHVQQLSGILGQASAKERGAGVAAQLVTRRVELQANCFGGMFLASIAGQGSVSTGLADAAVADYANTQADPSHGTVAHQVRWGRAGYHAQNAADCNTWSAPASDVS